MYKRIISKNSIPIFLAVFLFVAFYILSIKISQDEIRSFLSGFGIMSPVVYILLVLLTHIFAPFSGTPFTFVGFLLFGQWAIIYITIARIISSFTNFLIAQKWGRPLVSRFIGEGSFNKIDKLAQNYGLGLLFILRVFEGGSEDYISYAAGLTKIKFIPYIIISLVGMIPGTILWYFLSKYASTPLEFTALTLGMGFVFSVIFITSIFISKKLKS